MAKKQQQTDGFEDPYGLSDDQKASMVQLGRAMGSPEDEFDREVQRLHEVRHEAEYAKMRAAQTGGASEEELGPTEIEQQLQQQAGQRRKNVARQQAMGAQQAQAQQTSPTPPAAPTGAAGTSQPYPAQTGPPPAPSGQDVQPQVPGVQSPGAEAGEIES